MFDQLSAQEIQKVFQLETSTFKVLTYLHHLHETGGTGVVDLRTMSRELDLPEGAIQWGLEFLQAHSWIQMKAVRGESAFEVAIKGAFVKHSYVTDSGLISALPAFVEGAQKLPEDYVQTPALAKMSFAPGAKEDVSMDVNTDGPVSKSALKGESAKTPGASATTKFESVSNTMTEAMLFRLLEKISDPLTKAQETAALRALLSYVPSDKIIAELRLMKGDTSDKFTRLLTHFSTRIAEQQL